MQRIAWLTAVLITVAACSQPVVVASWDFDQAEGTVLKDVSGNGHDGAIHGATWGEGRFGGGLIFDGKDDYVSVPASPDLDLLDAMTVEVWARLDAFGERQDRVIIARADHPLGHGGWGLDWGYGNDFLWAQDGEYRHLTRLPKGEWTHIVLVSRLRGHQVFLYVDGKPRGSRVYSRPLCASEWPLTIGRRGQGHWFSGAIDEVTIYAGALGDEQVAARFARQPMPVETGPPEPDGPMMADGSVEILGAWDKSMGAQEGPLLYQNLFVALANSSNTGLRITDMWADGTHVDDRYLHIGDAPGAFRFGGTVPSTITPGSVGVVNLKFMGCMRLAGPIRLTLKDASGEVLKLTARFTEPPAGFASVAFDEDQRGAWLYLRGTEASTLSDIELIGADAQVRWDAPVKTIGAGDLLPVRVDLSEQLRPGTPLLLRAETSAGSCFAYLRAYPCEFPVGMYRVQRQGVAPDWQPPEGREWLREYMDTFVVRGEGTGQAPDEWLEDCRQHFIDTLVPDYVACGGDPARADAFGLRVVPYGRFAEHYPEQSAISAWYSADEPGPGYTLARFQSTVDAIRKHDTSRPVVVTINAPVWPRGADYDMVDIGYQDTYPVPVGSMDSIAQNMASYRDQIAPKPVVFIPQCFRRAPGLTGGWSRFPTPDEERFMVMMSIAVGARGQAYFAYNVEPHEPIEGCGISTAPEAKALWASIGQLNLELRTLAPLLAKSCYVDSERDDDIEVSRLAVGRETMVFIVLNHDYEYTMATFECRPKTGVRVQAKIPAWLTGADAVLVDSKGVRSCALKDGVLEIGDLGVATTVIVSSDPGLREALTACWDELVQSVRRRL